MVKTIKTIARSDITYLFCFSVIIYLKIIAHYCQQQIAEIISSFRSKD